MSYLNPNDYFMWLHAAGGPATPQAQTDFASQYVIIAGATEVILPHSLGTSAVVPAFTPSWNTIVWPTTISAATITCRFSVPAPNKYATLDYSVARGNPIAVATGAISTTITHNLNDASRVFLFSANWNTTIRISNKTANGFTANFSAAAPANALFYYAEHADSVDAVSSQDSLTAGQISYTISHNLDRPFLPIFLSTSWYTAVRWVNKFDSNSTIVGFSVPVPTGGTTDWRVKGL